MDETVTPLSIPTTMNAPAFNPGNYGHMNIALVNAPGIAPGTQLVLGGNLTVTVNHELPYSQYAVDIVTVLPAISRGIIHRGDTVAGGAAAPTLTSLTPNTAVHGGASQAITVAGTGFQSGATLQFGASNYATTFVSSTQLTVTIGSADLAAAGAKTVTVTNPDTQVSGSQTFTLT